MSDSQEVLSPVDISPSTQWTSIIAVIQGDVGTGKNTEAAHQALEMFCRRYYEVVKKFFLQRRCEEEEAQDFTQEFFENKICSKFDDRDGFLFKVKRRTDYQFRNYLFTVLWRFFIDKRRERRTVTHESLEEASIPAAEGPMGYEFDRIFALELLRKVLDDNAQSRAFLAYIQNKNSSQAMAESEAAKQLGMTHTSFKVGLHRFRRALGGKLWQEVSLYAGPDEQEIKSEILHLIARATEPPV